MARYAVYGSKRNYPKIDIFVGDTYACSTTWARTCKEAVQHFMDRAETGKDYRGGLTGPVTARRTL